MPTESLKITRNHSKSPEITRNHSKSLEITVPQVLMALYQDREFFPDLFRWVGLWRCHAGPA